MKFAEFRWKKLWILIVIAAKRRNEKHFCVMNRVLNYFFNAQFSYIWMHVTRWKNFSITNFLDVKFVVNALFVRSESVNSTISQSCGRVLVFFGIFEFSAEWGPFGSSQVKGFPTEVVFPSSLATSSGQNANRMRENRRSCGRWKTCLRAVFASSIIVSWR